MEKITINKNGKENTEIEKEWSEKAKRQIK